MLRISADGKEGVAFGLYTTTGRAASFLAPTTLSRVRMALAVWPDLPMTLPMSSGLTDTEINTPIYVLTAPILEDMFGQMSKRELPEVDEWPAWLGTNPSIVTQILDHWRTVPKVSGVPSPN